MIILYKFGPGFGLPDSSPACIKAEAMLKMAGLEYETNFKGLRKAPKGKQPYIEDDGEIVADSTFIRFHIENKYGFDFDAGLDERQKGIAWAVEKLLEDNLYWVLLNDRWRHEENFNKGPRTFFEKMPFPLRVALPGIVRKQVIKASKGHGMGRHTPQEVHKLGARGVDGLAAIIGENKYLLGDKICGADATCFAFLEPLRVPGFDTPMIDLINNHKNLKSYLERMRAEWFPA